jgi:programmed cell death protein 4
LNREDPNYDSNEEDKGFVPDAFHQMRDAVRQSKMTLTAYKHTIEPLITEYFMTGDPDDMLQNIREVGAPEYAYECVKRAVNMSFDKTDRERELVSQLLSIGYPDTFSANMVGKGFERLFEIVDEIEKDVPTARDMVAKFVSRAVVDEVLPPSFLSDAVVCNLGGEMVDHAKRMLSRDHGGGLLDRSWGPGDGRPVEDMKVALDQCLQEFLLSGDLPEAARCIRELNAKFFFHEVVKRAVTHAVDKEEKQQEQMSSLLQYLMECDMLSTAQAIKGFHRLHDIVDDLALDTPAAASILQGFVDRAISDQVIPETFSA